MMLRNTVKIISVYAFCLLFSIPVFAVASGSEVQQVDAVVQTFIHAYEHRDLNQIVDFYSPNAVVIGTGADEIIQGRTQIAAAFKRDFAQRLNATIQIKRIAVTREENIALGSYYLTVSVQMPHSPPFKSQLRFSVVLQQGPQGWHILQSHLSAPLTEQKTGQAFPKTT